MDEIRNIAQEIARTVAREYVVASEANEDYNMADNIVDLMQDAYPDADESRMAWFISSAIRIKLEAEELVCEYFTRKVMLGLFRFG